MITVYSHAHALSQVIKKLSLNNPSPTNTVKVHIYTHNRIVPATLALSSTKKQEKGTTTAYSPFSLFEENNQSTCTTLSLPQSLFNQEAMDHLQFPSNLAASSSSVHSSDGSLISVFNTEAVPQTSSTYTNLEPSIELPVGDSDFFKQILEDTDFSTLPDTLDLETDLFSDLTEDNLFDFDSEPMIQELTNVSMDLVQQSPDLEYTSSLPTFSNTDETSIASVSSQQSDEQERDDTNRRGLKKSGGPVRKLARFGNKQVIKYSEEYHDRRIKNNEAVKKSRMKAKEKQKSSDSQMTKLTEENRILNDRVDLLMKELQVLRSLYKELKHDSPGESLQALNNTH